MTFQFHPIGTVRNTVAADELPRHWTLSEVEGVLEIDCRYQEGISHIEAGQRIVVLFCFHASPPFESSFLTQTPKHQPSPRGVFSICSPRRPNPIGLSVVEVLDVSDNHIRVKGLDMFDGTPILDIKPHIELPQDCPSYGKT